MNPNRWLRRTIGLLILLSATPAAGELLLSVSPGGGQRPPDPLLRTIDPTDGSTLPGASVPMTLAGHTVVGATGLARHPQTGVLYVLLKVEGSSFRRLATLAEQTGVASDIGDTGRRFAGMAFGADATLYAVTGDGSGVAETLFTLSVLDASSSELLPLGAGSDGETLAFNPDDGLLYHASGIGVPNHPNGERFETIDPGTLEITSLSLSGFDYEELTALVHSDGAFFAGDLGDAAVDMPRFYRISTAGAVTFLGDMDHVSKGLAPAAAPTVPAVPGPARFVLGAALALAVWRPRGRSDRQAAADPRARCRASPAAAVG